MLQYKMRKHWFVAAALQILVAAPPVAWAKADGPATVEIEYGNIILVQDGARKQLTNLGRDSDPVLTADGRSIIFTRHGEPGSDVDTSPQGCKTPLDELRRIAIDGTGETTLLAGRRGDAPERMLCEFQRKQFASDGRTLYFLTPGWATSAALHAFDIVTAAERYVLPANDVLVLSKCKSPQLRDHLVVQQHRYFVFGGSYDWYWVFDPSGKRELGPVGEAESLDVVVQKIEDFGSCR